MGGGSSVLPGLPKAGVTPLTLGRVQGGARLGLRGKNLTYLDSVRAELWSNFGDPGHLKATREWWRACMLRTRLASGGVGAASGSSPLHWSQDRLKGGYGTWPSLKASQNTAAVRLVLSASPVFGCLARPDWHISDPAAHRSSLSRKRAAPNGRKEIARHGG